LSTELNQAVDDAIAMGQEARGKANDKLTELTEQAQQARSKVREVISAVHDGSASDEDLDTAVKQATYALRHLRDYLKK
jgi:hypothetical protein